MKLPLECKKLILVNALFQGGRLFVGAICVLYFISFGLNAGDYAWLKTLQSIIFIGLDIPIGYLLNKMGEYKSLLISLVFGIIGILGYLLLTNFHGFLISEIFLALSLSTWPTAYSAYSMKILSSYKTPGLVERFFHVTDAVSNIFVLACGSVGAILYAWNKYVPYGFFLLFYFLNLLFLILFLTNFKEIDGIECLKKQKVKISIKEIKWVLPIASIIVITQFVMQPLFHYWQPFFTEKFGVGSQAMTPIFIAYSLSMSIISLSYSRATHAAVARTNLFVLSVACLGALLYALVGQIKIFSGALIAFSLSFGILNLVQVAAGILIQNQLGHHNRMVITKYVSFYTRLGMILSLNLLHYLFVQHWTTNQVYQLYGIIALCSFSVYLVVTLIKPKTAMDHGKL